MKWNLASELQKKNICSSLYSQIRNMIVHGKLRKFLSPYGFTRKGYCQVELEFLTKY
ncbi:hypothetical protein HanIR_Chr05g0225151 [Helianthus annuus]|nr:hypothetical protein HanIR_Chr05g0225151 [Helianthus annuus]